jgi:hypothetical protein
MQKFIGVFLLLAVTVAKFIMVKIEQNQADSILSYQEKSSSIDFTLTDYTDKVHIHHRNHTFIPHKKYANVQSWLSSVGAFTAVADFNGDGWQDIYLGSTRKGTLNHLYQNMQNGTFKEVAKEVGVADVNTDYPSTGALFFDCDNDDDKDLMVFSGHPKLFINENNIYKRKSDSGIKDTFTTLVSAFNTFDYDRDGDLDLIIGEYFKQDLQKDNKDNSGIMPMNFTNSQNFSKMKLYKNNGSCHFTEVKPAIFKTDGWHLDVGIFDYFDNNKYTVWFASDYGEDYVYTETEKGKYKRVRTFKDYPELSKNGMSVSFSYMSDDNIPSAYVSNTFHPSEKLSGNLLWQNRKNSDQLKEISHDKNVLDCGWAWTNTFTDINNDGHQDILVNNGFISGDENRDYWYTLAVLDSSSNKHLADYKNWPKIGNDSLAGHERDCLFLNRGDGFENVASLTDFDKLKQDGRGLAMIDYLNNGSRAIITANRDGISKFYHVEQKNKNNWIGFNFKGTKSNHDGLSVKVTLLMKDGGVKKFFHHPTNHFSSQSDSRLHIGLGKREILSVKLHWPSGIEQILNASEFKTNQYNTIVEQEK